MPARPGPGVFLNSKGSKGLGPLAGPGQSPGLRRERPVGAGAELGAGDDAGAVGAAVEAEPPAVEPVQARYLGRDPCCRARALPACGRARRCGRPRTRPRDRGSGRGSRRGGPDRPRRGAVSRASSRAGASGSMPAWTNRRLPLSRQSGASRTAVIVVSPTAASNRAAMSVGRSARRLLLSPASPSVVQPPLPTQRSAMSALSARSDSRQQHHDLVVAEQQRALPDPHRAPAVGREPQRLQALGPRDRSGRRAASGARPASPRRPSHGAERRAASRDRARRRSRIPGRSAAAGSGRETSR